MQFHLEKVSEQIKSSQTISNPLKYLKLSVSFAPLLKGQQMQVICQHITRKFRLYRLALLSNALD